MEILSFNLAENYLRWQKKNYKKKMENGENDQNGVVFIKKENGITQILRTLDVNLYIYYFYQIERANY